MRSGALWPDFFDVIMTDWTDNLMEKNMSRRGLPDFVLRIAALFDRQAQFFTPSLGRKHDVTSAKALAALGWKPRPAAETIVDCANSLIAIGAV
jgi:dihydroflavonol-4-reductase